MTLLALTFFLATLAVSPTARAANDSQTTQILVGTTPRATAASLHELFAFHQARPIRTVERLHLQVVEVADDLGPTGWDTSYGAGRVNAARAVALALQTIPGDPPTTSDTTPPSTR